MRAIVLQSSSINAVAYHYASRDLYVMFRSGKWYEYADVPETILFHILFQGDSYGKQFEELVKRVDPPFSYREIDPVEYGIRV